MRCTTFVYRNCHDFSGFLTASLRLPSESHPLTGMGREDLLKTMEDILSIDFLTRSTLRLQSYLPHIPETSIPDLLLLPDSLSADGPSSLMKGVCILLFFIVFS